MTHLSEEHVLHVVLTLNDVLAVLLHLGVLVGVTFDLFLQLLVLVQQLLRLGQRLS